ncbi:MAG TPA: hypothetical protein VN915_04640 [Elusimicrobiota bacterium]|nr:hypothetical protein [Elusimicrobiota bacterium]
MRLLPLAAATIASLSTLLSACALGSDRVETHAMAPSFRAKTLAIAPPRGASAAKGEELVHALAKRLGAGGIRAPALEEADSVLAGSALGLDAAADPRVMAEIRRATEADGVVFLSLDPSWRSLDVSVLDAVTGDAVLRATARPSGEAFESPDEAAAAAAEALSGLAPERRRAAAAASEKTDEIPLPDVGGGD